MQTTVLGKQSIQNLYFPILAQAYNILTSIWRQFSENGVTVSHESISGMENNNVSVTSRSRRKLKLPQTVVLKDEALGKSQVFSINEKNYNRA